MNRHRFPRHHALVHGSVAPDDHAVCGHLFRLFFVFSRKKKRKKKKLRNYFVSLMVNRNMKNWRKNNFCNKFKTSTSSKVPSLVPYLQYQKAHYSNYPGGFFSTRLGVSGIALYGNGGVSRHHTQQRTSYTAVVMLQGISRNITPPRMTCFEVAFSKSTEVLVTPKAVSKNTALLLSQYQ